MALVGVFSGGAATWLTTIARSRAQNKKDTADASQMEAAADAARASAFENLWNHVNAMSEEYDKKIKAAEAEAAAAIESIRDQLAADIHAKDIRIKRLEVDIVNVKKSLEIWRSFAEGVLAVAVVLDAQLRANHITPAASLPAKPKTGPLD